MNSGFRVHVIPVLLAALALCSAARAEDAPPCKNHYILSEPCALARPGLEWQALPDSILSHDRSHASVLLGDGRVLVIGGAARGYDAVTDSWPPIEPFGAETYDPSTSEWRATAPMNRYLGYAFQAVRLLDGRVLVVDPGDVAGGDPGSAEVFDPANDTWTPTGTFNTPRGGFTMTPLPNGKVLAAGGADGGDIMLASAELWDPDTGAWALTGSLFEKRAAHTAAVLSDGKVLVVGGIHEFWTNLALGSAEVFDPATETWSKAGSIDARTFGHSATLTESGEVLVAGGYVDLPISPGSPFTVPRIRASAFIYNPEEGSWRRAGDLNVARYNHLAVPLSGFGVLVLGGDHILPHPPELLARGSASWSYIDALNALPMPLEKYHSATRLADGTVLFIGEGRSAALLKYGAP